MVLPLNDTTTFGPDVMREPDDAYLAIEPGLNDSTEFRYAILHYNDLERARA
jgi:hypothetical protein